jgi:transposase
MNLAKYIGMDVHQATISVAVMDSAGKLVMESILETKAATILQFIQGLRGSLLVSFEEGTSAAWLHDLLKPHVRNVMVCDPRKNALLKDGSKSDRIDARKLAELLRSNLPAQRRSIESPLDTQPPILWLDPACFVPLYSELQKLYMVRHVGIAST